MKLVNEFVGESGPPAGLRPILEAWLLVDPPGSVKTYLKRSPARHVLMAMVRGELAPTHEALDVMEQTSALAHLRGRLVSLGVLPERDERMAALAKAVRQMGSETQGLDGGLLRQYGRWSILRRAQLSTRGGMLGEGPDRYAMDCVRTAVGVVNWLHGQDRRLGELTQSHVDAWIVEHPSQRPMLRSFLLWLQARGEVPDRLRLDWVASRDNRSLLEDDVRLELVKRCLRDVRLDVRTRLAGCLVLLFGQSLTRIVTLTNSSVTLDKGRVWLKLGRAPLPMATPIDHLVLAVKGASAQRHRDEGKGWLFPGQVPGQHLSPGQLSSRLHQIGIGSALTGRNTARAAMAADVPAVVLAEKLGFSVSAIEGWADAMGQERGIYLSLLDQATGSREV